MSFSPSPIHSYSPRSDPDFWSIHPFSKGVMGLPEDSLSKRIENVVIKCKTSKVVIDPIKQNFLVFSPEKANTRGRDRKWLAEKQRVHAKEDESGEGGIVRKLNFLNIVVESYPKYKIST